MRREVIEPSCEVGITLKLLAKKKFVFNAKNCAIEVVMQGEIPMPKSMLLNWY